MKLVSKKEIDVSRVFLAFTALQGDVQRTALAVDLSPAEVQELADDENWAGKLRQFDGIKENDANFQITLNRTLSFIQARQLSGLVDTVISHLSQSREVLIDALTTTTRNGSSFDTKPLTDLVKSAEMLQAMTARALGDTAAPLANDDKSGGASIGLNVIKALNAVSGNVGVDPVTIVKQSLNDNARLSSGAS